MTKNARLQHDKRSKQVASGHETTYMTEALIKISECQQQGCIEEAEKLCSAFLAENPAIARAYIILGDIFQVQGRYEHAVRAYRRAMRIDRRDPSTHFKLATVLESIGKLSEAVASYETCLVLAPNDLNVLICLGGAYLKFGKLQECERRLQMVFAQTPNASKAHVLAGELALARGLVTEAVKHFQRALYVNPNLPLVQAKLGRALKLCGAHAQAIEALQFAVHQPPHDIEILIELSSLQAEMGDIKAAELSLRRAIEIKNDSAMLRVSLASSLVLQGKLDDALREYLRARTIEPTHALAIEGEADCLYRLKSYDECYELLKNLANTQKLTAEGARTFSRVCRKKGDDHSAVVILENLCKKPTSPARARAIAHFALGDAYDAMQDFETAFYNYKQANDLLGEYTYVPQVAEATTQRLLQAYSSDYWSSLPRAASGEFKPIFIMGMPRSGTSLTEQIIASHPDVCGVGELPFVNEIFTAVHRNASFLSLNADQINLLANQYYSKAGALIGNSKVMTDKMPGNIFCLGLMAKMFPDAAYVHCTRHPLDTCLSIYFQQFSGGYPWAINLENIAHYYKQYRRFVQHWCETLGISMLEVRYESLVSGQETQSRRLIEYCGLGWDEQCLSFHRNPRHVPTASYDQVDRPLYSSSIGRWKNYRQFLKPLIEALGEYAEAEQVSEQNPCR